jgi:hypothetical protein
MISLEGAVDMHLHSYPDLIPRIADDRTIAEAAANAGMAAIQLKCHIESTVSRAYALQGAFPIRPDFKVFGGIVLNRYVGGINPQAVEAALRLGGKTVWMPTIDAAYHALKHGGTGRYDVQSTGQVRSEDPGISILREDGRVTDATFEVVDLVAKYNAILATSHLSPREIFELVKVARQRGVEKIVITHPYFKVPRLTLEQVQELVGMGCYAELGYCTVSPMWAYATIEDKKHLIETVGPERCILMSDAGQRHNPMPHEALRIFAQSLFEKGISEGAIRKMIVDNPRQLLGME